MTVDWFFGRGRWGTKVKQLILIVVGWLCAALPVVGTVWALANREETIRRWGFDEAFEIWDQTMAFLGVLLVFFAVAFMALFVANQLSSRSRHKRRTYDEQRLSRRRALAEAMYDEKFGPRELRTEETNVYIQPYGDIETFELRGLYRQYGGEQ